MYAAISPFDFSYDNSVIWRTSVVIPAIAGAPLVLPGTHFNHSILFPVMKLFRPLKMASLVFTFIVIGRT
jgi:hypothetical protein